MLVSCKRCVVALRRADHSFQMNPIECGVSEYDREASKMRRPWLTGVCRSMGGKNS